MPTRAWAKEAVFPAERFPGAATRGPEMRSTGEVMAGAATAVEAYARALRAAGRARSAAGRSARHCRPQRYPEPCMQEILDAIDAAEAAGEQAAVATVVDDAPLGAAAARREDGRSREGGRFVGSVSGGCVEADVAERAKQVFAGEPARQIHYGVSDGDAFEVGLSCGGEIDVWLEKADAELWRDVRALLDEDELRDALHRHRDRREAARARRAREHRPARRRRLRRGDRGPAARDDLRRGRGRRAPLRLRQAARLAHDRRRRARRRSRRASACRAPARSSRPGPTRSIDRIDERTVVVTLSHEERLDIPADRRGAASGNARYIGAIGAKRTAGAPPREAAPSSASPRATSSASTARPASTSAAARRRRSRSRSRPRSWPRPRAAARPTRPPPPPPRRPPPGVGGRGGVARLAALARRQDGACAARQRASRRGAREGRALRERRGHAARRLRARPRAARRRAARISTAATRASGRRTRRRSRSAATTCSRSTSHGSAARRPAPARTTSTCSAATKLRGLGAESRADRRVDGRHRVDRARRRTRTAAGRRRQPLGPELVRPDVARSPRSRACRCRSSP